MPEPEVITSEAPEMVGKSKEELQTVIDGKQPEKEETTRTETKDEPVNKTDEPAKEEQKPFNIDREEFEKMKRQVARVPGLQRKLQEYERMAQTARTQNQPIESQEEAQAKEQFRKLVFEQIGVSPEEFQSLLQVKAKLEDRERHESIVSGIHEYTERAAKLAGEEWKTLEPVAAKLFAENFDKAMAGDEAARDWMRDYEASPAFVVLEARRVAAHDVTIQAARAQEAKEKARQSVAPERKTTQAAPAGELTEEQLANLPPTKENIAMLRKMLGARAPR